MKKLTTNSSWFGPFEAIETTDTAYIGDGCVMPFDVVGTGVISDYDPAVDVYPPSQEELDMAAADARAERNKRLAECDWTQLTDAPVDAAAWATYRQALRDVPNQVNFPAAIDWPQEPE